MHIYLVLSLLIIFLIILEYTHQPTTSILTPFNHDHDSCCDLDQIMNKCRIPDVSQQLCYYTQNPLCPRYNGSYKQCTNNYLPAQNTETCPCHNRSFEMCPLQYKVSQRCVNNEIKNCPRNETAPVKCESDKPRVNQWKYQDNDDQFMVQCK